jgi:uncharacterized protein YbjT (DUF2867 family)
MYVVAGVTGRTGSAVADALLARGCAVRVVVRSLAQAAPWRARRAEAALASLGDGPALAEALRGAAGAYLLLPPDYRAPDYLADRARLAGALATAVRSSGIDHVVLLSSMGAHLPEGTGLIRVLHAAEQTIGPAARNITILRAAFFVENWSVGLGAARTDGMLPSFLTPRRRIPMVATRDIGRAAAAALLAPARGRRIIELAGPAEASPDDVAAALASLLDRPVRAVATPLDAVVPALTGTGVSPGAARLFQEMFAALNAGHLAFEHGHTDFRRGTTPLIETLGTLLRHADGGD